VQGPAAEVLVDQWTEPFAHVTGGDLDVEYRLVALEDTRGVSAGCAACGSATPISPEGTTGADRCGVCGAVTWLSPRIPGTGRLQLGVRIDGIRRSLPFKALLPIVTGEATLRADAARGASSRSGSSLLGVTGVGCATALALCVLAAVGIAIAAHMVHC
jgi:hypothetical protein